MRPNPARRGIITFFIETIWSSELFWNLLKKTWWQIKNGQTDVDILRTMQLRLSMVLAGRPAITGYFLFIFVRTSTKSLKYVNNIKKKLHKVRESFALFILQKEGRSAFRCGKISCRSVNLCVPIEANNYYHTQLRSATLLKNVCCLKQSHGKFNHLNKSLI